MLTAEQKIILSDFNRFMEAIIMVAAQPSEIAESLPCSINAAEEIALIFEDECKHIADGLFTDGYIEAEIYRKIYEIDSLLNSLSSERMESNWTLAAMNSDSRWIKARRIASEIVDYYNL